MGDSLELDGFGVSIGKSYLSTGGSREKAKKSRARAGACEPPAPSADPDAWRLEPHVCRACFSRLVSQPGEGGARRWQCTNCGQEAHGADAAVLCCCGLTIRRTGKGGASGAALVDAGIRCGQNPSPAPDFPSLFVALER